MSHTILRKTPLLPLLICLLFGSAALAQEQCSQPFVGVTVWQITRQEPRPLRICVAEVDLRAAGISFLVSPGNGDPNGDEPGDPNNETTRQTTLDFLTQHRAQLAINASFFQMGVADTDNQGLVVSRGERVSPFRGDWPAININACSGVCIVRGKDGSYEMTGGRQLALHNAVTGSDQIVTDGRLTTDEREFSTALHPRTAIGYTRDCRLVLVTVDGRQPGLSEGMSLGELGALMLERGCVQALNLDGGGSTTMVIADPEPRVLNLPSSKTETGEYGVLRQNGTSLAVFARGKSQ